ncbi:MAG: hypothetical protein Q7V56_06295 [Gammaproteobacteria bacterium]|nr:hypothetical protein [Gammaproteobacteria bacterium]
MAMNELQRQAYLRELGIQSYFPRRALPGAKAPRLFGASALGVENAPSPVGAGLPAIAAPAPNAAAAPITVSVSAAPPRFAFAYFPVSEELAVINELPWAKSASVSPACRQLLAGMLRALGMPSDERALTSMVFTWPLLEGPDIEQGEESARQTLAGFLARRLKLRPVRYLLVLAEQSTGYLFPADFDWQQGRGGLQRHPLFDMNLVVTRSLNAMDAVPDLKREVWQAMQPLRLALAN